MRQETARPPAPQASTGRIASNGDVRKPRSFRSVISSLWDMFFKSDIPDGEERRLWLQEYLRKREMPPPVARVPHVWGLGVGCVISGEFYGWNLGLREGGLGGLIVATVASGILYFVLTGCLCELTAALPFSGGSYAYARATLGKFGGYFAGISESIEYTMFAALVLVAAADFITEISGAPPHLEPLWWVILLFGFMAFHCLNYVWLFRTFFITTLLTCIVFVGCIIPMAMNVDFSRWAFLQPLDGSPHASMWFPNGLSGCLRAMPGAMFFWLGFDSAILAAEETLDKEKAIPRGLQLSYWTLTICSILLISCGVAVPPGSIVIGNSSYPLTEALAELTGSKWRNILILVNFPSLLANFHALMFAYTRQTYALSRAGYLPKFLSVTSPARKLPVRSLLMGAFYNATAVISTYVTTGSNVSTAEVLLALSVLSACLVYMTIAVSFIILRVRCPRLHRPYVSPLGIPGAVVLFIFSGGTVMELIVLEPNYRVVVALFFVKIFGLGLYFWFFSRKHLVDSPEEVFVREHLREMDNVRRMEESALTAEDKTASMTSSTFSTDDVLDPMPERPPKGVHAALSPVKRGNAPAWSGMSSVSDKPDASGASWHRDDMHRVGSLNLWASFAKINGPRGAGGAGALSGESHAETMTLSSSTSEDLVAHRRLRPERGEATMEEKPTRSPVGPAPGPLPRPHSVGRTRSMPGFHVQVADGSSVEMTDMATEKLNEARRSRSPVEIIDRSASAHPYAIAGER